MLKILYFVKVFDDNLKSCIAFEMALDAIVEFHASAAISIMYCVTVSW